TQWTRDRRGAALSWISASELADAHRIGRHRRMICREPADHLLQIVVLQLRRCRFFGVLLDLAAVVSRNLLGHHILIGAKNAWRAALEWRSLKEAAFSGLGLISQ